jgi:hypothetical protein
VRENWRQSFGSETRPSPAPFALTAIAVSLLWLVFVANNVVMSYVSPHLQGAMTELLRLIANESDAGRQLFDSSSGYVAPVWERLTAITAAGLTLLGLPWGISAIWRRYRLRPLALTLAGMALAYPLGLSLRLTSSGWEVGNRSSEFIYLGVAFVLAVGIAEQWPSLQRSWKRTIALVACASVLFFGGVIAGFPPTWRLPGPYLPQNGARSIEAEGVGAAEWARDYLAVNSRVGADQINTLLMGSYGEQHIVTTLSGGVNAGWILFAPRMEGAETRLIKDGALRYLVVDNRLRLSPNLASVYFPGVSTDEALDKFNHALSLSRVFDSGNIVIYDLEGIWHAP